MVLQSKMECQIFYLRYYLGGYVLRQSKLVLKTGGTGSSTINMLN